MNERAYGIMPGVARPLANYPHARRAGELIFISGLSARQPDGSIAGAAIVDGKPRLDIGVQTTAVIENIRRVLEGFDATLHDLCDVTCFLVDMADYAGFNEAYNRFFGPGTTIVVGPTRTTVAVRALPHPQLLIEIKAVAWKPEPPRERA